MEKWAKTVRTQPMKFVLLSTNFDIMLEQDQLRENVLSTADALVLTGLQKVIKVVKGKKLLEDKTGESNMSQIKVAQAMGTVRHSKTSRHGDSERMSETLVKNAIAAFDKGLKNKKIFNLISSCESSGVCSPFSSVSVVYAIIFKNQTQRETLELVDAITYHHKMGNAPFDKVLSYHYS